MSLTVACVFVKANVSYGVEYVSNLRAMAARHLQRPHSFVCLTDRPWLLPAGVEAMPIAHDARVAGWWAKVRLFDANRFDGRVLYLDLDSVVVQSLNPIVDFDAPFALVPHAGTFQPRSGHKVVRRFNSSVMVWDAGVPPTFDDVEPLAKEYWGDQDILAERAPDAAVMPAEWFPRLSDLSGSVPGPSARVVLCKKPKNTIAADIHPWLAKAWRVA